MQILMTKKFTMLSYSITQFNSLDFFVLLELYIAQGKA